MLDSQHQWNPSTSHVHWRLNECNCCHSLCEDNRSRWIFHIPICVSKTKLAPIKQLSIPKLELEAATLGAELAGFSENEMTITIKMKHFWTDSTAILRWIQSKQRQKIYIANRLTKNHENSNPDNWRHIPGKMNPADHGTRGLNPSDIQKLWLQPPDFLSTPQDFWIFAEDSDPHICATQATQIQTPVVEVEKFSTWSRLLNSTRMVFQAISRFKAKSELEDKKNHLRPPRMTFLHQMRKRKELPH